MLSIRQSLKIFVHGSGVSRSMSKEKNIKNINYSDRSIRDSRVCTNNVKYELLDCLKDSKLFMWRFQNVQTVKILTIIKTAPENIPICFKTKIEKLAVWQNLEIKLQRTS